jgi:hypothetical protein
MKIEYIDDSRNNITIERQAPGLYRLYGSTIDHKWREWTATSREIPNIERFLQEFQELGDLIIGAISGAPKGA